MPVPTTSQVQPGAPVSIVLKVDQRTGREVQGTVQNVLTSGNHPRGIKVRLSDGRIGRVQRMWTGELPALQPQSQNVVGEAARPQRERMNQRSKFQSRDIRYEDEGEEPAAELDLMAFVKPAKQKKGKGGANKPKESVAEQESATQSGVSEEAFSQSTATCPVCGIFEGDEAAVAHHVETHFS